MMSSPTFQELKPLTIPLQGINLIEASAGTGKTYTIETLFVRLVLETETLLTADKILVVTFTEAATEELRDRIRQRLNKTLTIFRQSPRSADQNLHTVDDEEHQLLARCSDVEEAINRLNIVLRGFDEASIFTIHSFCRRMLQDNAFESGVLFETELVQDQSYLVQEIVEDFWRQHFYQASSLFISYAIEQEKLTHPAKLFPTIGGGRYVGQPFLKIIPESQFFTTLVAEQQFTAAFNKAQLAWQAEGKAITALLVKACEEKVLSGKKYRKEWVLQWCELATLYFSSSVPAFNVPTRLEKLTAIQLAENVNKGQKPPTHPFFNSCEQFLEHYRALAIVFKQQLLALKVKLFAIVEEKLTRKKQRLHLQSFDDLLTNLYQALKHDITLNLARQIHGRYQAVLIDEFQDTDPVQYAIFRTVYREPAVDSKFAQEKSSLPPFSKRETEEEQKALFLIGDPKQAIYSFRGADIFTYIKASEDATNRYTLAFNRRSEPSLVQAVNTLFSNVSHPFLFEKIEFHKVHVPPDRQQSQLYLENQLVPPLQLWFMPREGEKLISKTWANKLIPRAVANEISRLLQPKSATIRTIDKQGNTQNKPVTAGDIAILVRSHRQAHVIQKVLLQYGIPSVLYSRESIFVADEAVEMERLLLAVAEPNHEGLVKAALTTDLLGYSGNELHTLVENEREWHQRLNRFQHYHFLWQNVGFIQMFRSLLIEQGITSRLLRYADGERRLTNLLHLAELLQQVSVQQKLGMSGLCTWLARRRLGDDSELESEAQQLRLESDEDRVKIVTIHKSKGLQYPIVFCPFAWDGRLHTSKATQFIFHDAEQNLTLDLGSPEQETHRKLALQEEQAENLRLLYVAITRAKHRCYLVWGALNDAQTSALAHLLHPDGSDLATTDDQQLLNNLQNLVHQSENTLQVSLLPTMDIPYTRPPVKATSLQARTFNGVINREWRVASFTALTATHRVETLDQPDYDETVVMPSSPPVRTEERQDIFSFPSGARPGMLMHSLLELADFTQLPPDQELIAQQLHNYSYDATTWQTVFTQFLTDVMTTPLEPQRPQFYLAQIGKEMRLNELEFHYPLARLTPAKVHRLFAQFGWELAPLEFSQLHGLMKGFIDMVFQYEGRFYLVDYKSNFLGTHTQAYHHSNLRQVMLQQGYVLQYHIYAIALHRYLALRLPNYRYAEHFGGVYYLFLRGMRPQWGANFGIYRDVPSIAFIEAFSGFLK